MCLLPTKKVSHSRNETPVHSLYNLIFSPFGRSASLLSLEKAVEIGAGGESAFERDDVVGIVRIFQHHLFCRIETYVGEPYSEGRIQALVEECSKLVFGDANCIRESEHVHRVVLVA